MMYMSIIIRDCKFDNFTSIFLYVHVCVVVVPAVLNLSLVLA